MTRHAPVALWERAAGLALGVAADFALGDPSRFHPVAGFGRAAGRLERAMWADSRLRGAAFTAACVGAATAVGALATRLAGPSRAARIAVTALAAWATIGGRGLTREGAAVHDLLAAGDLAAARRQITHLVGRDPANLTADEIARAAVESIAENASDAAVAPLVWGMVAGVPGMVGYRAVNTLDAMVGYKSPRHLRFGWASARLDDAANLLPSRVTAAIVALTSADPPAVWAGTRRFARRHPSPNSGWCEAAYAARLRLTLGGRNSYGGRVEERPLLGDGRPPAVADIPRAARLTSGVILVTTGLAATGSYALTSLVTRVRARSARGRAAVQ